MENIKLDDGTIGLLPDEEALIGAGRSWNPRAKQGLRKRRKINKLGRR